jgi:hypothetical protein
MKPKEHKEKYRSYLLRLWVEDVNGKQVWRILLENPYSGERRGFASMQDLCAYFQEKMREENEKLEVFDEE